MPILYSGIYYTIDVASWGETVTSSIHINEPRRNKAQTAVRGGEAILYIPHLLGEAIIISTSYASTYAIQYQMQISISKVRAVGGLRLAFLK